MTGVLLVAGIAKIARPSATATALRALRIPSPIHGTRLLGTAEVIVAVAAIVNGSPILWSLVTLSYAAFTAFILWALRDGTILGSCGCFGREDTPPTPGHAAFNAAAATVAGLAIADPVRLSDFEGSSFEAVLLATLVLVGATAAVAALTELPRTLALAKGKATPTPTTFSLRGRP